MQATRRSDCPVACALDLAGDKWTLLVVRDLLRGRRTYGELADSPEGIPTNILADRLKRLEAQGLITREAGSSRGWTYRLTRVGADLLPTMQALATWGHENIADRWAPPEWFLRARPQDFYPPENRHLDDIGEPEKPSRE